MFLLFFGRVLLKLKLDKIFKRMKQNSNFPNKNQETQDLKKIFLSEVQDLKNSFVIQKMVANEDIYNYADIAFKLSQSKIKQNQRLLHIKNGFFFYFTKIPKNWTRNKF